MYHHFRSTGNTIDGICVILVCVQGANFAYRRTTSISYHMMWDSLTHSSLKLEPRESPVSDPTPGAPKKSSAAPACPVSAAVLRHHSRHACPGAPQGRHHPLMHGLPPGLGSPRLLTTAKLTWVDKALGYPRKWPARCSLGDSHCGAHWDCLRTVAAQAAMSLRQARGWSWAVLS